MSHTSTTSRGCKLFSMITFCNNFPTTTYKYILKTRWHREIYFPHYMHISAQSSFICVSNKKTIFFLFLSSFIFLSLTSTTTCISIQNPWFRLKKVQKHWKTIRTLVRILLVRVRGWYLGNLHHWCNEQETQNFSF